MGELGATAPAAHRELGRLAAALGLDAVFALGTHAQQVADGAAATGMPAERIFVFADLDALAERIAREIAPGDWVLVKGSRSARMERIVERLAARGKE
jgi:UDP-N-acetylmuramoyl-tripeptide--D-alanyl-D-alanine ligase